jgi:predicted nucleotidyltransferase
VRYIINNRKTLLSIISTILLLVTLMGCEPSILLRVENQSDSDITVLINGDLIGSVPPATQETFNTMEIPFRPDVPEAPEDYLIEAKTSKGEVVYSEQFTWQELHDMDWMIVIPPP